MQEEVENRTINLAISMTKLTSRTIFAGIRKYLEIYRRTRTQKRELAHRPHGKQTVKELLGQNQGATNAEVDKNSLRDFERIARKYGVDYAVKKDRSTDPPRFYVFVRAKDSEVLDAICREHQTWVMSGRKRPSILTKLEQFKETAAVLSGKIRTRERQQERER